MPKDVGTYTVKITVEEGDFYKESSGYLTSDDWKFAIKLTPTIVVGRRVARGGRLVQGAASARSAFYRSRRSLRSGGYMAANHAVRHRPLSHLSAMSSWNPHDALAHFPFA